ncbi:MAG: helix-turn-helix domain-containing protein [Patescibacteria group bacterium]
MIKDLKNYLKELGFNKNEASVYLALAKLGEAKASQVAKLADLPRTTAISILNKLAEENYITTHIYKGVMSYWIESPQVLLDILNAKLVVAEKLKEILPTIYHVDGHFPFAKFFDTKNGIKNFIEKTLNGLEKGAIIYTIDTPNEGNYSKIFSDDLRDIISDIKKRKGIITKTLVPSGSFAGISQDKLSRQNIIIKELPESLKFQGSLWLINDLLINFSGNPPFLSAIRQNSIVDGIKNLYTFLWSVSIGTK